MAGVEERAKEKREKIRRALEQSSSEVDGLRKKVAQALGVGNS